VSHGTVSSLAPNPPVHACAVPAGSSNFAHFIGLTPTNLKTGLPVNGGSGSDDVLLWTNTVGGDVARYTNWEQFEPTDGSELTFDNFATLTLGDSGTGTGVLSIDETSTVFAGNGTHTVAPFTSGQLVTVNNWGAIDLTNNNSNATDSFVVQGNYVGHDGSLNLQTFLESDDSPSDRLVIDSGQGSGSTSLLVTNVGGPGALTFANGIRVVDAINGATTTAGAFTLGGSRCRRTLRIFAVSRWRDA
jgi:autotransporter family porin